MTSNPSIEQEFLVKLNNLIELNLENEKFTVAELAASLGKSRSQLHRKLHAITGKSTSQFIREFRLKKAMEMLQNNEATASEIAYKVGFGSPSYFSTCFHDYYGYPPGEVKFRNPSKSLSNIYNFSPKQNSDTIIIKKRIYNLRTYIIGALALMLFVSFAYYKYAYPIHDNLNITEEASNTITSIAVLPFKNISGNNDDEAFCDGMTTAIISRLSKIKSIKKVISHTSMMHYKNSKMTMPEIADNLNVHYILESSFQKSANNIKINLQLIDGPSDKLFWSSEYEGKSDSIFKIQALVAEMVAKQLDADITQEEQKQIEKPLTNNTEAYKNYLIGKRIFSSWTSKSHVASRRYFEKAIQLDSSFAEAYYNVGLTYSLMGIWGGNITKKEANTLSKPYFDKALQLCPDNYELLKYLAYDASFDWNFKKSETLFKKLDDLGDKYVSDGFYFIMGNSEKIVTNYFEILEEQSMDENYSNINWRSLPYALFYKGEIEESKHLMNIGLKLHPSYDALYDHFGNLYLAMEDYETAQNILETGLLISEKRHASMVIHLAVVYHNQGNHEKSQDLLNEVILRANSGEPEINVFVAHYYARIGNHDEAFKWLNIAFKKHEVDLIWLKADPNLLQLKDDYRYKLLCKKVGFLNLK
ncbi:helix-turn-helix domain-containing protein [Mariniflexile sp.]|uniref:helix-turn-helix domain-containing protein n=1 Tax=Mariniflexile sp. TaxID=1979402 RepID=UPI003567E982